MDLSASRYNSVSESGWTNYIDQTSLLDKYFQRRGSVEYEGKEARLEEEEEEEGLSMVSDASSGPPHYHDEVDKYSSHPSTSLPKKKVRECGRRNLQQASHLDDTASSPVYSFPTKKVSFTGKGAAENAMALSQGFSATRLKANPQFQKHFNLLECSSSGKQSSEDQGDSEQKDENQT
ncbi:uncharacterized protein LOC114751573 isoform X2 [Neltuma alba]|uniref:uncharacterized protein LOC114751573 isoform X2 n=1 Tax=Neltuma alba TaxID=207710 RepID=UPI0010A399AC|nr:uncharacterized protein LOC114751573 isoform X2 [Prosopis alba]